MAKQKLKEVTENNLSSALAELNKAFTDGNSDLFITCVDDLDDKDVHKISTGIPVYDRALGGGYPEGKIIEIFGAEGMGKTTIQLHVIAEWQKQKKKCVFLDLEGTFDKNWATKIGVNNKELLFAEPNSGEQCMDAIKALCGKVDLIVVDSVAAMTPQAVLDASNFDNFMGAKARMMAQGLDQIISINKRQERKTTIVFINQVTTKFVIMGDNTDTPGGKRLKFYAALRVRVSGVKSKLDEAIDAKGHRIKIVTKKNRFYPKNKTAEFNLMYDGSIDIMEQFINLLGEYGSLGNFGRAGSFYNYGEQKFQGGSKFARFLFGNPKVFAEFKKVLTDRIEDEIEKGGGHDLGLVEEETTQNTND